MIFFSDQYETSRLSEEAAFTVTAPTNTEILMRTEGEGTKLFTSTTKREHENTKLLNPEHFALTDIEFLVEEKKIARTTGELKEEEQAKLKERLIAEAALAKTNMLDLLTRAYPFRDDMMFMLSLIEKNGLAVMLVDTSAGWYRIAAIDAVKQNGDNLDLLTPELRRDEVISLRAIQNSGAAYAFEHSEYPEKYSKEFLLKAAKLNFHVLQYAGELRDNLDFMNQALAEDYRAAIYLGPLLSSGNTIHELVEGKSKKIFGLLSEVSWLELKKSPKFKEYVSAAVVDNPYIVKYLSSEEVAVDTFREREFRKELKAINPEVSKYLPIISLNTGELEL
ncbi:MAG TPA: hypothetical protein VEA59_01980 [Patescibacteria group bacterium]|nr:hypothetical protein [Patescibacteria group bacterium]